MRRKRIIKNFNYGIHFLLNDYYKHLAADIENI